MTKFKPHKPPKAWLVILAVCSFLLAFLLPTRSWGFHQLNFPEHNYRQVERWISSDRILEGGDNLSSLKRLPIIIINKLGGESYTAPLKEAAGKSNANLFWNPKTGNVYAIIKGRQPVWVDTIDLRDLKRLPPGGRSKNPRNEWHLNLIQFSNLNLGKHD